MNLLQDRVEEYKDVSPKRGPYSHSRINDCDAKFNFKYGPFDDDSEEPKRSDGTQLTRYGRSSGSAAHELAELDVNMRLGKDKSEWLSPGEMVERFVTENPSHNDHFEELCETLELFRRELQFHDNFIAGVEDRLGTTLDFQPSPFNGDKTWWRGIIDLLEIDDANLALVRDYKNRPTPHSWRKFREPDSTISRQQLGYGALVLAQYPQIQAFSYEVYYFQTGQRRYSHIKTNAGKIERRYIGRKEIENRFWPRLQRKMLAKERQTSFPPQPTRTRCQYCSFTEKCPFWQEHNIDDEFVVTSEDEAKEGLEQLAVLKEKRKRLSGMLADWAKEHGIIEADSGAWMGYPERTKRTPMTGEILRRLADHFDIDDADELIEKIEDDLRFTKRKTDSFVKSLPDSLRDDLQEHGYAEQQKTRKKTSF